MTRSEMANKIDNDYSDYLFYLYERWQDEKEFEDFNDYVKAFKERVPETIKGKKSPFSFIIRCDDGDLQIAIKTKGTHLVIIYYAI